LAGGGRLFLTGTSGLNTDGSGFLWDLGADYGGISPFCPDYVLPDEALRAGFVRSPMVMYAASHRIRVTTGQSLGLVHDSYFNRTFEHFCSHRQTPYRLTPSGFDCGVRNGNILYLAHPVFTLYKGLGAVALREYIVNTIRLLLGEAETIQVALPSTGRVTLMKQSVCERYILHLLHANTIQRGGEVAFSGGNNLFGRASGFEVIEDLLLLTNIEVRLHLPGITKARLVPHGVDLPLRKNGEQIGFTVPVLECHQMVELS
jgi:hypothetical protein